MKNIIFTLLMLAAAASAMAQDFIQPVARTRQNPQVHSKDVLENMKKDPKILEHALATPYVKPEAKIYDFAGFFKPEERDSIRNRCLKFIEKCKCDMVIAIVSHSDWPDYQNEDFIMDFYDYNDFGVGPKYSGIALSVNMGKNRWSIIDHGSASAHGAAVENGWMLEDAMRQKFMEGDFVRGLIKFVDAAEEIMRTPKIETMGYDFSLPEPRTRQNLLIDNASTLAKAKASDSLAEAVLGVPAVDASRFVYDFTKQISQYDISKYQQRCKEFCEKHNWELAFNIIDQENWLHDEIETFQSDMFLYNRFGFGNIDGGLYFTANARYQESGCTTIRNCSQYYEPYIEQYEKLIDKFGIPEFVPAFVDMLESHVSHDVMVKDGNSISDIIKSAEHSKNRLFDISGTLLQEERDTIEAMLWHIAETSGRNMTAAVIYAANYDAVKMRQLANQILDKRKGDRLSMLVINQYDLSCATVDDDGGRALTYEDSEEIKGELGTNLHFASGEQIARYISRYNYLTMTIGERLKTYSMYPMASACCSLPVALILAITLCMIFKRREYGIHFADARRYLDQSSFRLLKNNTIKGKTTETTKYSPPPSYTSSSSSSSRSGGGYRSGSSGRSHGSRSGGW